MQKSGDFSKVGIAILAAGASTRMGSPKQLLLYQGRSLLRHTVEAAIASKCRPIIVILGANFDRLQREIADCPVEIVENRQWTEGMSSSIRTGIIGLNALCDRVEAIVIALCDQPFVSPQIFNQLVKTYHFTGQPIVASEYAETLGVPALFNRSLFSELMALAGDKGAKAILSKYSQNAIAVPFADGAIDIDTPKDYEQLRMMTDD